MIKKILLGAGTALSAVVPIVSVVSCGEEHMNDYSKTKNASFWSGEDRESRNLFSWKNENKELFIEKMDANLKIMDYEDFVNDIGQLKIFNGTELISLEEIKKDMSYKSGVDWTKNSKNDKTWIKAYIEYIDDIYYYWNDEGTYNSKDNIGKFILDKKTEHIFNQEKKKDNQYHQVKFVSYKGIIFYNLGDIEEIIYGIENQDQLDKLNKIFENMKKYPKVGEKNENTTDNDKLLKELRESLGMIIPGEGIAEI